MKPRQNTSFNANRKLRILAASVLVFSFIEFPSEIYGNTDSSKSRTANNSYTFSSYSDLKASVLGLIGQAKKNIVIVSDFLSDGDIASALYIAQYRGIDVLAVLNPENHKRYFSRYDFLIQQNVPVINRSGQFAFKAQTLILTDNKLYEINSALNSLQEKVDISVRLIHPKWNKLFVTQIAQLSRRQINEKNNEPATPSNSKRILPNRPSNQTTKSYPKRLDATYNYDKSNPSQRKAPEGVARKLPKVPVYIKKLQAQPDEAPKGAQK